MSLLEEVKEHLRITWDDEDNSLKRIIERGKANLEDLTGTDMNFEQEGQPKSLLLEYCRYAYNNALEYYEENFQKEILRLQLREAVKHDVKKKRSNEYSESSVSPQNNDLEPR